MPLVGQVYHTERATLIQGNCLEVLPGLDSESIDAVVTDPPYPCIKRNYGMWTEDEWWNMMIALVSEVRRVLKPTGSAVFVLQPNSRKVGSMRSWLWEFMAWVCREWNMVQDAWWWNPATPPTVHVQRTRGGLRPSVKACVWCGPPNCYRNQNAVLWEESSRTYENRCEARARLRYTSSGAHNNSARAANTAQERGGATPFNLLPMSNCNGRGGHAAATPLPLCRWWTRYICPPSGMVLDPFSGSGTVGIAALKENMSYIGIEIDPTYCAIAKDRLAKAELACVKQKET